MCTHSMCGCYECHDLTRSFAVLCLSVLLCHYQRRLLVLSGNIAHDDLVRPMRPSTVAACIQPSGGFVVRHVDALIITQ